MDWPADAIERRLVADLIPYARNPREHSPQQVSQIAASIREWGWTTAILCAEDGTIIAGHGRVMAAQQLGLTDVPVMVARGWSEAQRRAYVIADNQLTLAGSWDEDRLRNELGDLHGEQFAMGLLGFDADELERLMYAPDFEPGTEEDQGQLDQLAPKIVTCPHCGEEFDSREQG
jgi:ParB-like chromosome segregation protein Spo0J